MRSIIAAAEVGLLANGLLRLCGDLVVFAAWAILLTTGGILCGVLIAAPEDDHC